jgi:hypothetical protein
MAMRERRLKRLNKLRTRVHVDVNPAQHSGFNNAAVGEELDVNVQTIGDSGDPKYDLDRLTQNFFLWMRDCQEKVNTLNAYY